MSAMFSYSLNPSGLVEDGVIVRVERDIDLGDAPILRKSVFSCAGQPAERRARLASQPGLTWSVMATIVSAINSRSGVL